MNNPDIFDNPGTVVFAGSGWAGSEGMFSDPVAQYAGDNASKAEQFIAEQAEAGHWLAGIASYDFGLKQHGLSSRHAGWRPLIHIYAFSEKQPLATFASVDEVLRFSRLEVSGQTGYIEKVRRVKALISAGDVYQLNLATKFTADYGGSNSALFQEVIRTYPEAHLAYLNLGDTQLISASPELFLGVEGNRVVTQPIKGTRPRGESEADDEVMREELENSPKEQAELNMITDLLRNDLAGVCETGSVRVERRRELTAHAKVWHASSFISGSLKNDMSAFRAFLSCLPGGSITGCPKRRAMELIGELEDEPRGYYTGSIFQLSPVGEFKSSIAIRTLERTGEKISLGVGSGIVYDSDPLSEWNETVNKAYLLESFLVDYNHPNPK